MADPDLSEFVKLSRPRKAPCLIGLILERQIDPKLSADDVAKLQGALDTDQGIITNAAVAAWIDQRGHEVHPQRVLTHRKGSCTCGRS